MTSADTGIFVGRRNSSPEQLQADWALAMVLKERREAVTALESGGLVLGGELVYTPEKGARIEVRFLRVGHDFTLTVLFPGAHEHESIDPRQAVLPSSEPPSD